MRRERLVTINDRGNELTFKIREMSALQLERWICRAALALADSGALSAELPGGAAGPGEAAEQAVKLLSARGLEALGRLDFERAEPLYNELLQCCSRVEGGAETLCTPDLLEGMVQDVRTLFRLRFEALKLNFDFFTAAAPSASPGRVHIERPRKPGA